MKSAEQHGATSYCGSTILVCLVKTVMLSPSRRVHRGSHSGTSRGRRVFLVLLPVGILMWFIYSWNFIPSTYQASTVQPMLRSESSELQGDRGVSSAALRASRTREATSNAIPADNQPESEALPSSFDYMRHVRLSAMAHVTQNSDNVYPAYSGVATVNRERTVQHDMGTCSSPPWFQSNVYRGLRTAPLDGVQSNRAASLASTPRAQIPAPLLYPDVPKRCCDWLRENNLDPQSTMCFDRAWQSSAPDDAHRCCLAHADQVRAACGSIAAPIEPLLAFDAFGLPSAASDVAWNPTIVLPRASVVPQDPEVADAASTIDELHTAIVQGGSLTVEELMQLPISQLTLSTTPGMTGFKSADRFQAQAAGHANSPQARLVQDYMDSFFDAEVECLSAARTHIESFHSMGLLSSDDASIADALQTLSAVHDLCDVKRSRLPSRAGSLDHREQIWCEQGSHLSVRDWDKINMGFKWLRRAAQVLSQLQWYKHQLYLESVVKRCHMHNCFDRSKCVGGLVYYIYPYEPRDIHPTMARLLEQFQRYMPTTNDPSKACMFVVTLDLWDRDPLSVQNTGTWPSPLDVTKELKALPHWNDGFNHIILNAFTGTWQDYWSMPDFDTGNAMVASATHTYYSFRRGFDVVLPHIKPVEISGGNAWIVDPVDPVVDKIVASRPAGSPVEVGLDWMELLQASAKDGQPPPPSLGPMGLRPMLASFKGKRYVSGVGSEARDALYRYTRHARGFSVLLTCAHLNYNELAKDDPWCEQQVKDFDAETRSYDELLAQSTFGLCPYGRRKATYRLLELVRAASIPVVIGAGTPLPFEELIDWSTVALTVDDGKVPDLPSILAHIPVEDIVMMQTLLQDVWKTHFATYARVGLSLNELLHNRIFVGAAMAPACTETVPLRNRLNERARRAPYMHRMQAYPFDGPPRNPAGTFGHMRWGDSHRPGWLSASAFDLHHGFTVVQLVHDRWDVLMDSISMMQRTTRVRKLIIVMNAAPKEAIPGRVSQWTLLDAPIELYYVESNSLNNRFFPFRTIETEAVLHLDDDIGQLTGNEIEFGFDAWFDNPTTLVGWYNRMHEMPADRGAGSEGSGPSEFPWAYSSHVRNVYSMVLTGAAFLHRDYSQHYWMNLPGSAFQNVMSWRNGEDVLMNLAVSAVSERAPVKITALRMTPCLKCTHSISKGAKTDNTNLAAHMMMRSALTSLLIDLYGQSPFRLTNMRAEPVPSLTSGSQKPICWYPQQSVAFPGGVSRPLKDQDSV